MSQLPRLQKGQGREMLLKSVELGSQLPESCSLEVNLFWRKQQFIGIWTVFPLGTCRLNSKSCQLWLSPPWGPNPAKPEFTIQRCSSRRVSGICWVQRALQWAQLPWMLLHDTQGAWASGISWTGRPITASLPLYQTRSCDGKVSRSSLRTNGEIPRPFAAPAAQDHLWVKPGSAPLSLWPQTKVSQCRATRLWAHRTDDSENQSLV